MKSKILIGRKTLDRIDYAVFVIPAILFVTVQMYIPFIMSMYYSLTDWNGISPNPKFIGMTNFLQIFQGDTGFNSALILTFKYTVLFVIITNIFGVLLAIALDRQLKSGNILRALFFLPYIMSLVVVGFVWKFILVQGFDSLGKATNIGFFKMSWLGTPHLAFVSIVIVSIWQGVGFYMVIYLAGLQAVPKDLLEAATIDGANAVKKFFGVTLPMLMPSVTICVFLSLTNAIKLYDIIVSLTAAGPAGQTASITYDIYREEFQNNNYGYGTAKALILFVIVAVLTIVQVTFFRSKEVDA